MELLHEVREASTLYTEKNCYSVIRISNYVHQTTFNMSECIRTLKLTMAFNRICWHVCKLVA